MPLDESKCATGRAWAKPEGPAVLALDAVEEALAKALEQAAIAGRFDVVAQLARELEARRTAHAATNVIALDAKRTKGV